MLLLSMILPAGRMNRIMASACVQAMAGWRWTAIAKMKTFRQIFAKHLCNFWVSRRRDAGEQTVISVCICWPLMVISVSVSNAWRGIWALSSCWRTGSSSLPVVRTAAARVLNGTVVCRMNLRLLQVSSLKRCGSAWLNNSLCR